MTLDRGLTTMVKGHFSFGNVYIVIVSPLER